MHNGPAIDLPVFRAGPMAWLETSFTAHLIKKLKMESCRFSLFPTDRNHNTGACPLTILYRNSGHQGLPR